MTQRAHGATYQYGRPKISKN